MPYKCGKFMYKYIKINEYIKYLKIQKYKLKDIGTYNSVFSPKIQASYNAKIWPTWTILAIFYIWMLCFLNNKLSDYAVP